LGIPAQEGVSRTFAVSAAAVPDVWLVKALVPSFALNTAVGRVFTVTDFTMGLESLPSALPPVSRTVALVAPTSN
jgi:hypothetical protein